MRIAFADDAERAALLDNLSPLRTVQGVLETRSANSVAGAYRTGSGPYRLRFGALPAGQYILSVRASRATFAWIQVASFGAIGEQSGDSGWLAALDLQTHRLRKDVTFSSDPSVVELRQGSNRTVRYALGNGPGVKLVTARASDGSVFEIPIDTLAPEQGDIADPLVTDVGDVSKRLSVSANEQIASSDGQLGISAHLVSETGAPMAGRTLTFEFAGEAFHGTLGTLGPMMTMVRVGTPDRGSSTTDADGDASFSFAIPPSAAGHVLRFSVRSVELLRTVDVPVGTTEVAVVEVRTPSTLSSGDIVGREIVTKGTPTLPLQLSGTVISLFGERVAAPITVTPDADGVFFGTIPLPGPVARLESYEIRYGSGVIAHDFALRPLGAADTPGIICETASDSNALTFRLTGFFEGPAVIVVGNGASPDVIPVTVQRGVTTFTVPASPIRDGGRVAVFGLNGNSLALLAATRGTGAKSRSADLACDGFVFPDTGS